MLSVPSTRLGECSGHQARVVAKDAGQAGSCFLPCLHYWGSGGGSRWQSGPSGVCAILGHAARTALAQEARQLSWTPPPFLSCHTGLRTAARACYHLCPESMKINAPGTTEVLKQGQRRCPWTVLGSEPESPGHS